MRLFILLLLPFWLFAEAKPKVLFVNAFHFSKVKLHHVSTVLEEQNISFTYKNVSALKNEDNLTSFFKPYDFVIFDAISSSTSKKVFEKYSDILQTMDRQFMTLKVLEEKSDFRNKVSFEVHQQIYDYLDNGGLENFKRFSQFLAHDIFGVSDQSAKKAIIYPKTAIYHPKSKEKFFTTLEDYFTFLDSNITGKPIIALSVYRDTIASIDTALIDATIARLESKGAVAVAFYYAKHKSEIPYKALLSHNGKFMPDALVNFKVMHQASKRRAEFETLEIPVFGALVYRNGDQKAYEEDPNGINIMSMPFYLSIPEAAGVINPMMIAAVDENSAEKRVIDYQLDSFVQRILNYTNLQAKPKAEKKAAFFFWNYPSGQNAMGASFLNVPESLAKTFSAMKKEGYSVDEVNASFFTDRIKDMMALYYRDVNASQLVSRDLCELYPLEKYLSWFNALPQKTQDEINNVWGDANSSSMLITQNGKRYFTIPRMKVKNMIVLPQGSRAENKSQEGKSYHDMATPVSHGYLAVYHYVKSVFGVDAIVHVGTHGSQEWLKGKDRGLSLYDSPNLAVGDIPVIYPYIVDDVGEAMQTKRRGSAVVLSHLTPPFSPAGLHDELVVVHELMHQYSEMTEGITKEKTKEEIVKMSKKLSFDKEVSIDSSDFDTFIEVLHDYMDEIAQENQPLGLHTYGEVLLKEHRVLTIMQMLGSEYGKAVRTIETQTHSHDGHSHSHNEADHVHGPLTHTHPAHTKGYEKIPESMAYKLIEEAIDGTLYEDDVIKPYLEKAVTYNKEIVGSLELTNFLKAMDGAYISTSTGGDPVRSPDILPTGRNLYGFDPSKVPTKAAYESGKVLTKELIANYYVKHGLYPDKLAFSLWSIETMRHYGVLESQILYALGIKPKWNEGGRVIGMEVIPYSELKRPRIDVVISATGLYRDAFPNVMEFLDEAVRKVVELKEEHNFVRRHAKALEAELKKEGMSEEKAEKLSTIRIFSNASGSYGTGLAKKVMASGTWDEDKGMSDAYLGRMGFAFGSDLWSEKSIDDLYRRVLKGTDAAMFSRSSNVYGLLSSDDPFQYLGGIALAVRNIDGKTPELFISNLRNKSNAKVEDIQKFMSKELRTRYMHPGWIKAMQEEGFAGAQEIVGTIQNAWGWEVMDPTALRDDQWQEFVEVYINDKHNLEMKKFFEEHNPDALAQISERFLEAIRKGYFKTDEKTVQKLVETYMEIANKHNVYTDNEKFKTYVKGKAVGYGLSDLLPAKIQTTFSVKTVVPKETPPKVKGQELQEEVRESKEDHQYLYFVMLLSLVIFSGVVYGFAKREKY